MFMDLAHAGAHKLPIYHLSRPRPIRAFDGTFTTPATLYTRVSMNINGHFEKSVFMFLTNLEHYAIIVGLLWLREHSPRLDFHDSLYSLVHNNVRNIGASLPRLQQVIP